MKIPRPLVRGRLIKRYKRFLADVELEDGTTITAHTANPGSMLGLKAPGSEVLLTHHPHGKRKLPYSWDFVRVGRSWVGVNTGWPNRLVEEALEAEQLPELAGYGSWRREVAYGSRKSRIDLLGSDPGRCYVEVKNVSLVEGRVAMFPDAVTERGRKHLLELADVAREGHRAVLCFVVQRRDAGAVSPADAIDPAYGETLREVLAVGVEAIAYQARFDLRGATIRLENSLPVVIPS